MQNPLQQKVDSQKAESKSQDKRFSVKDILLILFLVLLAISITIALIYIEISVRDNVQEVEIPTTETLDENDSGQRFWFINKIEPIGETFRISLSSNAGNIRVYEDLVSFGLSQNRELLATNTGTEIEIIKLIDESFTQVQIPSQKFAGSIGESITWDRNNEHFAMSVYTDDKPENGTVWIFGLDGKLKKEVGATLYYDSNNRNKMASPIFSPTEDLFVIRTYKKTDAEDRKDDDTLYSMVELPVYLNVYDLEGAIQKEIMIRDFDTTGKKVYYQWDTRNVRMISYYVYPTNTVFDPTQDYLFTKVRI